MKSADCNKMDEIFTHIDEDGTVRHINASAMFRDAAKAIEAGTAEVVESYIDADFIDFIRAKRGVEKEKLDRLIEPFLSMPCLGFWWPDGSMLTVDGHHRLVRWHERGDATFKAVVFEYAQIDKYCVEDMPEELSEYVAEVTKLQLPTPEIIILH